MMHINGLGHKRVMGLCLDYFQLNVISTSDVFVCVPGSSMTVLALAISKAAETNSDAMKLVGMSGTPVRV